MSAPVQAHYGIYRRQVEPGVFDALLDPQAELVGRDRSADMIDSTVLLGRLKESGPSEALDRSRGSFSTKPHAR